MPVLPRRFQHVAAWSLSAACALLAMIGDAPAWAAAGNDPQAQAWAASCISCHAPSARPASAIPPLEGLPADWIATRMRTLAGAASDAGVMGQIARGYTDAEIIRIADWFAGQPKADAP